MVPLWKKWSKNREPDQERVEEMVAHGGYIPRFIHLAELADEGLVCYDGNHRREVLKRIAAGVCLVDIMFGASHEDVYDAFVRINRGVEVPEIYMDDGDNILQDVTALVKTYETRFKPFVSASSKCHAPNFNRDVLTENITKIYRYLQGQKTVREIGDLLDRLNIEYSRKNHGDKYKPVVIEKCKKHGLWLFLEREVSPEHVERLMHRKKFGIF